jgi:hypothetical protein
MYEIYALVDPRTGLPFYVGKGKIGNERPSDHLSRRRGLENRLRWKQICDIRKEGLEPIIEILVSNIEDEDAAYLQEAALIKKHGRIIDGSGILTNVLEDGRPPSWKGRVKSTEHRQKLSLAHKGKKVSKETIEKILQSKIANGTLKSGMEGKNHSEESKDKMRRAHLGKTMSDESSLKKSLATKGRKWSEERRQACIEGAKPGPKSKVWSEARRAAYLRKKHGDSNDNPN